MRVEVIRATPEPIEVISRAAGTCYGRDNLSAKRVETCYRSGHLSVFEHASVTLRVEGISRACMAQLTRHRMASFCVESQRYNKYDLNGNDWYVTPPSMREAIVNSDDQSFEESTFESAMRFAADDYRAALECGIKPEDARYLLPEATKTNLVMTCNLRELFHLFDMRRAQSAQWEIRQLADLMADELSKIDKDWASLIGLWVRNDLREPEEGEEE